MEQNTKQSYVVEEVSETNFIGVIKTIESRGFGNRGPKYYVLCQDTNKLIKVHCPFRSHVSEGDRIIAIGVDAQTPGYITLVRHPLIIPGTDMQTLTNCLNNAFFKIIRNTSDRSEKVKMVSDLVSKTINSNVFKDTKGELFDNFLKELSEEYAVSRDPDILENFNSCLNPKQTVALLKWWLRNRCLRPLYLLGFGFKEIKNCGLRPMILYRESLANPYTLAPVSIDKCRDIMHIINQEPTEVQEMCGNILRWVYTNCMKKRWTYVPLKMLKSSFAMLDQYIDIMGEEYNLVFEEDKVYVKSMYNDLINTVSTLKSLMATPQNRTPDVIDNHINTARSDLGDCEDQIDALRLVLSNRVTVISGPAGSGKTTLLKVLIALLRLERKRILIVSFTGKAVQRVKEVIGANVDSHTAICTIDRFVAMFSKLTPTYDHIFIDEASMVNISLLSKLLSCFNYPMSLTFIGDQHQLPPINWGEILTPIIESNVIPHKQLTKIHRTENSDRNGVFINANRIRNHKQNEPLDISIFPNFQMVQGGMMEVKSIIGGLLKAGRSLNDIVILTPLNVVLDDLNNIMRSFLPESPRVKDNIHDPQRDWQVGDRVILTKNNYDIGVMNGDEGYIKSINHDSIHIEFLVNGLPILYEFYLNNTGDDDISFDDDSFSGELTVKYVTHSFALSIHKSQGSQYPVVIGYFPSSGNTTFVNRNLVYTFIGRAKKGIFVVGDTSVFMAGSATHPPYTYNNLSNLLS